MNNIGIYVPARLKSERLPNKQILPLGNSCMFDICCQKLDRISSNHQINTYVLINDKELIDIASKYPNVKIVIRDQGTCETDGPLQYIFKDILNVPEKYLLFLNPCLTFLSIETILKAIDTFIASGKEYGTSAKIFKNWLWTKDFKSINDIDYKMLNTKEIEPLYQCAHCFHVFNKENFKKDGLMLTSDLCLLEVPHEEAIDIDTKEDYDFAYWKWTQKLNEIHN